MAIENLPYLKIYKGDYLRGAISGEPLDVQGLYFRIQFVMSESERYGYLQLNGSPTPPGSVARRCGVPQELYDALLQQLLAIGAFEKTKDGVIFCASMVENDKERKANKKRQKDFRENHRRNGRSNAEPNENVTDDVTREKPNEDEHESGFDPRSSEVPRRTADEKPKVVTRRPAAASLIVTAYPLKVKIPLAITETESALARLRAGELGGMRMSDDDAYTWLLNRVKAYAKSSEGTGAYAPNPDTWMRDKRYLDEEEAWYARDENRAEQRHKQSVQQAGDVLDSRRARRVAHAAGTGD